MRYSAFIFIVAMTLLSVVSGAFWRSIWYWLLLITLPLSILGVWDIFQTRHNLLRNYPLLAHLRWLFEGIRPEIRQYLMESDTEAIPFTREQRSLVYERAKDTLDVHPFGTDLDVYDKKYAWLNHSVTPAPKPDACFCITVGGRAAMRETLHLVGLQHLGNEFRGAERQCDLNPANYWRVLKIHCSVSTGHWPRPILFYR